MLVRLLALADQAIDFGSLLSGCRSVRKPCGEQAELYRSSAFVPGDEWTPLSKMDGLPMPNAAIVGIFSLPAYKHRFEVSGIALPTLDKSITPELQLVISRWLIPSLAPLLSFGSGYKPLGIARHPAGLVTTTRDKTGLRTGLHIDSWFGDSMIGRNLRAGRLTFNLGPGHRYFFALGPSISARYINGTVAAGEFVQDILEAPDSKNIVRIKLPAGYGYIAKTEDLIHDGSTQDSTTFSYTYTLMGHFGLDNMCSRCSYGMSPNEVC